MMGIYTENIGSINQLVTEKIAFTLKPDKTDRRIYERSFVKFSLRVKLLCIVKFYMHVEDEVACFLILDMI